MQRPEPTVATGRLDHVVIEQLALVLQNLRFGVVELTVHDGRIVQIERREKIRLDAEGNRLK